MLFVSMLGIVIALATCVKSLPEGWTSIGCWSDNTDARALSAASYFDPTFSTQEACVIFCKDRNYTFAGAEFGRECYCDNSVNNNATQQTLQDCNVPCPFDASQDCGGSNRLSLFTKNQGPAVVQHFSGGLPGSWDYVGSFNNTTPGSAPFAVEAVIADTATTSGSVENCLTWCFEDFACPLCSVSDGGVCECGNNLSSNAIPSSTGQAVCQKNSSEVCGDTGIWQVYQFTANPT